MKSTPKTKFSHYLLSNIFNDFFEDLILTFYIWVPNTTIEGIMERNI